MAPVPVLDGAIAVSNPTFTPSDWDPYEVNLQHDKIKSAMTPFVAYMNSNASEMGIDPSGMIPQDALRLMSDLMIDSLDALLKDPKFVNPIPTGTVAGPFIPQGALDAVPGAMAALVNPSAVDGFKSAMRDKLPDMLQKYTMLYKASLDLNKSSHPLAWIQTRKATILAVSDAVNRLYEGSIRETDETVASGYLGVASGTMGLAAIVIGVVGVPFTAGASLALTGLGLAATAASAGIAFHNMDASEDKKNTEYAEVRKAIEKEAGISDELGKLLTRIAQAWHGIEFSVSEATAAAMKSLAAVTWSQSGGDVDITDHDVMNAWAVAHSIVITNFLAHLTEAHSPFKEGKAFIKWAINRASTLKAAADIPLTVWRAGRVLLDACSLVTARLATVLTVTTVDEAAAVMSAAAGGGAIALAAAPAKVAVKLSAAPSEMVSDIFSKAALKIAAPEVPLLAEWPKAAKVVAAGGRIAIAVSVVADVAALGLGVYDIVNAVQGDTKLQGAGNDMKQFRRKLIDEYKLSCKTLAGFARLKDPGTTAKSALKKGEVLYSARDGKQDEYLLSPGGWFRLCCQGDGNLVLYRGSQTSPDHCMWATMTMTDPREGPFRLEIADSGGLRWMTANGKQLWPRNNRDMMSNVNRTLGSGQYTELQLTDEGNLQLVVLPQPAGSKKDVIVWEMLVPDKPFVGGGIIADMVGPDGSSPASVTADSTAPLPRFIPTTPEQAKALEDAKRLLDIAKPVGGLPIVIWEAIFGPIQL